MQTRPDAIHPPPAPLSSHKRAYEKATAVALMALSSRSSLEQRQENLSVRIRGETETIHQALSRNDFNMAARRWFELRKPVRNLRATLSALNPTAILPPRWSQVARACPEEDCLVGIRFWADKLDEWLKKEGF